MLRLHTTMGSVNGYKVRLLLAILGVEYEIVDVDMYGGEHKREPFLSFNRFGQMPALEDGEFTLGDSHACLTYVARKFDGADQWLPRDAEGEAKVAEWMSKSANEIHNGPWIARAKVRRPDAITLTDDEIHARCNAVLAIVDAHLADHEWLALDRATIADISIFCPVFFLPDSGYPTDKWKNVTAWLGRVRAIPGAIDPDGNPFG